MTIRMVCGPPGAGKNTYVDKHRGADDFVIDLDDIRTSYPDLETARAVRKALESTAVSRDEDVWVIRTLADPQYRSETAQRIGAEEVVVLATPADEAKRRATARDDSTDLAEPIDRWWATYQPNDSELVITPDMGTAFRQGESTMGDTQQQNGPTINDGGQQQNNSGSNVAGEQSGAASTGAGQSTETTDKGFPDNTPTAEMTAEQQIAYWKFHSRKHETAATSRADYEEQKAAAEKWRQHEQQQLPEQERAIAQAKETAKAEAATEARKQFAPQLVKAEFKIQAPATVDANQLNLIIEDLNHDLYIKEDGSVDVERVKSRVAALPAASQSPNPPRRQSHQGYRPAEGGTSVSAGRDMFAGKRPKLNS